MWVNVGWWSISTCQLFSIGPYVLCVFGFCSVIRTRCGVSFRLSVINVCCSWVNRCESSQLRRRKLDLLNELMELSRADRGLLPASLLPPAAVDGIVVGRTDFGEHNQVSNNRKQSQSPTVLAAVADAAAGHRRRCRRRWRGRSQIGDATAVNGVRPMEWHRWRRRCRSTGRWWCGWRWLVRMLQRVLLAQSRLFLFQFLCEGNWHMKLDTWQRIWGNVCGG